MQSYNYTLAEFLLAVKLSTNVSQTLTKLGIVPRGANYKSFHKIVSEIKLDPNEFFEQSKIIPDKTKKKMIPDKFIVNTVKECFSFRSVILSFGLREHNNNYKWIKNKIEKLDIDHSHFLGMGHLKGKTHNWSPSLPLEEVLIENAKRGIGSKLKHRLIKEGLLQDKCSECDITEWRGKKLSLHLDHINGVNTDYRIENLRLLCPNCHSLTDTYCRGTRTAKSKVDAKSGNNTDNKTYSKTKRPRKVYLCASCNLPCSAQSTYCKPCYDSNRKQLQTYVQPTKIEWPPIKELLHRLKTTSYVQLGKELGISDNAIRKHIKNHSKP